MNYVYVLFSKKDRRLYIGLTGNLHSRYLQHCRGMVTATKHRRPLQLIYYEAYLNDKEAGRRERYLKGGNGRAGLKKQLDLTLCQMKYRHLD